MAWITISWPVAHGGPPFLRQSFSRWNSDATRSEHRRVPRSSGAGLCTLNPSEEERVCAGAAFVGVGVVVFRVGVVVARRGMGGVDGCREQAERVASRRASGSMNSMAELRRSFGHRGTLQPQVPRLVGVARFTLYLHHMSLHVVKTSQILYTWSTLALNAALFITRSKHS